MRGVVRNLAGVLRVKGGKGSGHHGHAGRPGDVGGSMPGGVISLTSNEKAAIHEYTWLSSGTINEQLREGKVSTDRAFGTLRSVQDTVDALDSAIAKAPVIKNAMVLDSMFDAAELIRSDKLKQGHVVDIPGYMSVSSREGGVRGSPAQEFLARAVLKLSIRKGAKGVLDVSKFSHYPQEKEHIIRRGSRYRINSVISPNNAYIDPYVIDATLL